MLMEMAMMKLINVAERTNELLRVRKPKIRKRPPIIFSQGRNSDHRLTSKGGRMA